MIRVEDVHKVSWREGITMADLLRQLDENRPIVAGVLNGRYISRSHFSRAKIPDGAKVLLIPWKEGMTIADLLKHEIDEDYFSAATVDSLLIPEADFDATVISKDAEVWLLPPVGGG